MEMLQAFDNNMIELMRNLHGDLSTKIMKTITVLGNTKVAIVITLVLALAIYYICLVKYKEAKIHSENTNVYNNQIIGIQNMAYVLFAIGIPCVLGKIVKGIIKRGRPNAFKEILVAKGYSFPSLHSVFAGAMTIVLIFLIEKTNLPRIVKALLQTLVIILGILIAFSRIYLGVHFATDVIFGLLAGYIFALITTWIFAKFVFEK